MVLRVETLRPEDAERVTAVLCDAFQEYPVMRHVLESPADYDRRLETLVGFFVAARVLREDLILGLRTSTGELIGAALVTLPGDRPPPETLAARREATWRALGAAPRARYEAFGAAAAVALQVEPTHHHLNMIGIRGPHRGSGLARLLLERVHAIAARDPASAGVSLTTELESNVSLYRRFGYKVVGQARTPAGLSTWGMFRSRDG